MWENAWGEVSDLALIGCVVFLGEKTKVVAQSDKPVEESARFAHPSLPQNRPMLTNLRATWRSRQPSSRPCGRRLSFERSCPNHCRCRAAVAPGPSSAICHPPDTPRSAQARLGLRARPRPAIWAQAQLRPIRTPGALSVGRDDWDGAWTRLVGCAVGNGRAPTPRGPTQGMAHPGCGRKDVNAVPTSL